MNTAGRFWRPRFSPHGRISQVALIDIREALIEVFRCWGLPKAVKVDNGLPFGDPQRKTIPVLALWLISLDIEVIWNRPRQPTDNAKLERMQGTSKRWAELDRCRDRRELEAHLRQVALLQREHYRVSRLGYKTRKSVFPALFEVQRAYTTDAFDARRAYRYLAQTRLVRKVSSTGRIHLYGHEYQVGRRYRHQSVGIGFATAPCMWIIQSQDGEEIKRLSAKCLSPSHIWSLSVSQRANAT